MRYERRSCPNISSKTAGPSLNKINTLAELVNLRAAGRKRQKLENAALVKQQRAWDKRENARKVAAYDRLIAWCDRNDGALCDVASVRSILEPPA